MDSNSRLRQTQGRKHGPVVDKSSSRQPQKKVGIVTGKGSHTHTHNVCACMQSLRCLL